MTSFGKLKIKKDCKSTSGVFDFSDGVSPDSIDANYPTQSRNKPTDNSDVSASVWRRRRVAGTNDINIKGQDHWFNGMDILTYTDGYENRIDHDFVKYELRVPIQEDVSPQSNIESQGVGGTARFTEYIETSCNFKGVHKTVRFYLVQNIPMKCWIGWPQLVTFHAVINALEENCELKAL